MMLLMLILMITAATFSASAAMNPLTMGLLILFLALILAMAFASAMSTWVALLIFLMYIGGMLVMFSYFVAITPNQNMSMPVFMSVMIFSLGTLTCVAYSLSARPYINSHHYTQTNIMYESFNIGTLIMLALILLFTMVVVVKVAIRSKGPLRPFLKYV